MRGVLLLLAALVSATASQAADVCPDSKVPPLALPRLKQALAENREVVIVTLGSSSTAGWRASNVAHSYPAQLQAELSARFPSAHFAVINRGIGGQDATQELPRLERDVVGVHPEVVIWQVGANGAMRHMHPDVFRALVDTGVRRLQHAKIDVVLMDNQQAPKILASPEHLKIDQALADVAVATGAGLFARSALMDQWRVAGFPYADFVADDGVHHNDFGYRCVAQALTQAIVDGLGPAPASGKAIAGR